jgi:hypothetical protein
VDENAVFFIRQICLFVKKVFKVCDPERDQKALETFIETDLSLRELPNAGADYQRALNYVTRRIVPSIEAGYARAMGDESIVPRHGPGATADKAWANEKYRRRGFLQRWGHLFSWEELYGFSTVHQVTGDVVRPQDEQPVKVCSVPKTMKTSRIISVEPTAMQFAQQLVSQRMYVAFRHAGVSDQLNFEDQSVNQRAARRGSIDGTLATLDLSEASDRLSCKTVSIVFRHAPVLRSHLFGCRSSRAVLPGGVELHLRKYASMGSALTFPVEAFCFYAICLAAVCEVRKIFNRTGRPRSLRLFENIRKDVLVFGDDIIVPTDCVDRVTDYLRAFGLKVNAKKSFSTGPFRESCGKDYVNGVLVTPVYLRSDPPRSHRDSSAFVSWVNMSNRFYKAGLWHVANGIRTHLDKMFRLPLVKETCAGLGWHTFGEAQEVFYGRLHGAPRYFSKTLCQKSPKDSDILEGYDRLLYFHLTRGAGKAFMGDPTKSPRRNSLKLHQRKVWL